MSRRGLSANTKTVRTNRREWTGEPRLHYFFKALGTPSTSIPGILARVRTIDWCRKTLEDAARGLTAKSVTRDGMKVKRGREH